MSFPKPQKVGRNLTTTSSTKPCGSMAKVVQGSSELAFSTFSCCPMNFVNPLSSPLKFILCFPASYLPVTFVFENLLTPWGNLINQLHEGLYYYSISTKLRMRKEYSRFKQLGSGWEGLHRLSGRGLPALPKKPCCCQALAALQWWPGITSELQSMGWLPQYPVYGSRAHWPILLLCMVFMGIPPGSFPPSCYCIRA